MTERAVVKILGYAGLPSDPVRPLGASAIYTDELSRWSQLPVRTFSDQLDLRPEGMERWSRLDRYGRALVRAADLTLDQSRHRGGPPCGLVVVSQHSCTETNAAFDRGFIEKGPRLASPKLFPYTLPGSTASEAAIHFQLGGAYLIFAGGPATALTALATGIDLLMAGRAERLLILSADVLGPATLRTLGECGELDEASGPPLAEASAGLWLGRPEDPSPGPIRCIEVAVGPPDPDRKRLSSLIEEAVGRAGGGPIDRRLSASAATRHRSRELDAMESALGPGRGIQLAPLTGDAGASVGLLAVGAALDEDDGASLIIACDAGGSAAVVVTDN